MNTPEPSLEPKMEQLNPNGDLTAAPGYESPRVETVLTTEQLEREIHYAGMVTMN